MDQLDGLVQAYAWGDQTTIADMQQRTRPESPEAELWFGAHPVAPSQLAGEGRSLAEAVAADPDSVLGSRVAERFGRFPYLLKVLAAGDPLSIQAHPSLVRAKAGFAREEAAGIPWDSPRRTYRDDNHKPELICALTDFEAKCGFRPLDETRVLVEALLGSITEPGTPAPGLSQLARRIGASAAAADVLASTLDWLLRLSPQEAQTLVGEVVEASERVLETQSGVCESYRPDLAWVGELYGFYPADIGVVVSLLLNHVTLKPGQAMFLQAGNLHAYLRGAGVEVMASSDNVVRGGLTVKHIDVEELLAVVDTTPGPPPVQTASGEEHRFDSPVPEFSLSRVSRSSPCRFEPVGPEILLVTDGAVVLQSLGGGASLTVSAGRAAFVGAADGPYELCPQGLSTVWRTTVGDLAL